STASTTNSRGARQAMDDRIRVSDADRDRVAARLRDHFAEGRLTQDELDERISAALAAKTFGDLRRVMADLPEPEPVPAGAPAGPGAGAGGAGAGPQVGGAALGAPPPRPADTAADDVRAPRGGADPRRRLAVPQAAAGVLARELPGRGLRRGPVLPADAPRLAARVPPAPAESGHRPRARARAGI